MITTSSYKRLVFLRHWSSRLALRRASNFVSSYFFLVCCNFHNLEILRLALRGSTGTHYFKFSLTGTSTILYKKQIGTHREKKHVLTLTLMLVRRKSACKTSAGSSKIFRWLAPLLGPNLDPKTGPKQRPKRRNENVIQFWTPFWGPYLDPKMGSAIGEFRCCPQMFCKQICDPAA